jgi:hypothetical protein
MLSVERDHDPLARGVMNSTLTAFLLEVEDQSYGGGVLKMEAYEGQN